MKESRCGQYHEMAVVQIIRIVVLDSTTWEYGMLGFKLQYYSFMNLGHK